MASRAVGPLPAGAAPDGFATHPAPVAIDARADTGVERWAQPITAMVAVDDRVLSVLDAEVVLSVLDAEVVLSVLDAEVVLDEPTVVVVGERLLGLGLHP